MLTLISKLLVGLDILQIVSPLPHFIIPSDFLHSIGDEIHRPNVEFLGSQLWFNFIIALIRRLPVAHKLYPRHFGFEIC